MKILIAPQSSNGNLSVEEFYENAEKTIKSVLPDAEIDFLPVTAGGEGSLECLEKALHCQIMKCFVQNSLYEEEVCSVGFIENGKTAIIETAQSNGLYRIKGRENPEETSTYGVGQLIGFACDMGAKKILLSLGGSSTNDCGVGLLAALGGCFYNKDGISFVPTGGTLKDVEEIDLSMMYPRLQGARFVGLCDVDNPLYGDNGCSAVYGPKKGADEQMVKRLDEGCRHIASLFNKMRTTDFALEKGAGASGGLGFCVLAALNGKLTSAVDTFLSLCDFENRVNNSDLVITNENSFILNRCGKVPVVAFDGINNSELENSVLREVEKL